MCSGATRICKNAEALLDSNKEILKFSNNNGLSTWTEGGCGSYSVMLCFFLCFLVIYIFLLERSVTGIGFTFFGLGLFQACNLSVQVRKSGIFPEVQNSTRA